MKRVVKFIKLMFAISTINWMGSKFLYARNKAWFSDNPLDILYFEKECKLLDKRMSKYTGIKILETKVESHI